MNRQMLRLFHYVQCTSVHVANSSVAVDGGQCGQVGAGIQDERRIG
jgi:hypothetical protein